MVFRPTDLADRPDFQINFRPKLLEEWIFLALIQSSASCSGIASGTKKRFLVISSGIGWGA